MNAVNVKICIYEVKKDMPGVNEADFQYTPTEGKTKFVWPWLIIWSIWPYTKPLTVIWNDRGLVWSE